jgi:hypothetical protein
VGQPISRGHTIAFRGLPTALFLESRLRQRAYVFRELHAPHESKRKRVVAGRLVSAELYGVTNWDPMARLLAACPFGLHFHRGLYSGQAGASISPTSALRTE